MGPLVAIIHVSSMIYHSSCFLLACLFRLATAHLRRSTGATGYNHCWQIWFNLSFWRFGGIFSWAHKSGAKSGRVHAEANICWKVVNHIKGGYWQQGQMDWEQQGTGKGHQHSGLMEHGFWSWILPGDLCQSQGYSMSPPSVSPIGPEDARLAFRILFQAKPILWFRAERIYDVKQATFTLGRWPAD